jgi:hypothetical protein
MERDEYKFPDEIESEGVPVTASDDVDVEIEVVDDTPEKDRNRKASEPPEEVTDDELQDYSEKVRKRIQHFNKGYHDERRAKEAALREKEELERLARKLVEENNELKGTVNKNQEILLEQAKQVAAQELEEAKRKYKQAYESGDSDALVNAQEELVSAKSKTERVSNFRLPPLQESETPVQIQPNAPVPADPKAHEWQQANTWFGTDDEMTSFALGLHQKLVKQGIDPRSDDYYERINSRMREVFPDQFKQRRRSNVVAPATRSTAPRKIVLTSSQVAIAKRLGVPLEAYAKQIALDMRK